MQRISQAAKAMLENTILPFWLRLQDREHGGFYGLVDFDLRLPAPRWPPAAPTRARRRTTPLRF